MDYVQIKEALSQKDYSISLVAKAMGVSHSAISGVMKRKVTSKRIATGICNALELSIEKVFPEKAEYHAGFDPEKHEQSKLDDLREKIENNASSALA